jgi:hypothetical protein
MTTQLPAQMMRSYFRLAGTVFLIACGACSADQPLTAPVPIATVAADPTLFLTASDSSGVAGRDIVITGRFRHTDSTDVAGSFSTVLQYDASRLRFVEEVPVEGSMSAMNATRPGELRIAGANPAGYADGRLFALRFHTVGREAIQSLSLALRQLGSVAFHDQLSRTTVQQRIVRGIQ